MNAQEKQTNAEYFDKCFLAKSFYMWAERGHVYTKNSEDVMTCTSMEAWQDIKEITPKGWAKKNVKLVKPKPIIHACPSLNIPPEELKEFAKKLSKVLPELECAETVTKSEFGMGETVRSDPSFLTAVKLFAVSCQQKSPIKRFNLIILDVEGTYFSSQDAIEDTTCITKIRNVMSKHPANTENWDSLWEVMSCRSVIKPNKHFICVMNIGPKFHDLDQYQYATWNQ